MEDGTSSVSFASTGVSSADATGMTDTSGATDTSQTVGTSEGADTTGATTGNGSTGGSCTPNPCDPDLEICAAGECLTPVAPGAGDVLFVEIMPNPTIVSDVFGEWFELHNISDQAVDLNGCKLADEGTNFDNHTIATAAALIVPPDGIVVLAKTTVEGDNGGIPLVVYGFGDAFSLTNTGDELVLRCAGTVIDTVVYDPTWTYADGVAMQLDSTRLSARGNDAAEAWCAATSAYGLGDNLGTPGTANLDCG